MPMQQPMPTQPMQMQQRMPMRQQQRAPSAFLAGPPGFPRSPQPMQNFADDEALPGGGLAGAGEEQPEEEVLSSGALQVTAKVEYASLPRDAAHTVFGLVSLSSSTTQDNQDAAAAASPMAVAHAATSGTTALQQPPVQERVPMDVVCVLDVSGSMQGAKIQLLKEAQMFVADELGPKDRLSIVSFNHTGERQTSLARMTPEGRDAAKIATMRLQANGGTAIPAGLEVALRTLEMRRQRNAVSAIFLLTDGQDGTSRQQVDELVRRCRACGASLYAFGFGADHDSKLLGAFAEAAQTPFTFVEAPGAINAAFAGAVSGLMSVVAQRAKVRIECCAGAAAGAGAELVKVHTSFSTTPLSSDGGATLPPGKGATVEIPDLFAGERKDLLVELKVPQLPEGAAAASQSTELLRASVRYYDMQQRAFVQTAAVVLELERRPAEEQPEQEPDEEVTEHRQRVEVTNVLQEAIGACNQGNYEQARGALAGAKRSLQESVARKKHAKRSQMQEALETELEDAERRCSSATLFRQGGGAEMQDAMMMMQQQRCTNFTANTSCASDAVERKQMSKRMYVQQQQQACIARSSAKSSSGSGF